MDTPPQTFAGEDLEKAISDREFEMFQSLIHKTAGIFLTPDKRTLLVARLAKRLKELGIVSFREYHDRVLGDSGEMIQFLNRVCTNETHFFREPMQFEFLTSKVFPAWTAAAQAGDRNRKIRIWSAACSTGEEPYSLAMLLLDKFPEAQSWTVEILATDLSTKVLAQAQAGIWEMNKASEIPPAYLKAYMRKGTRSQEGRMKAGPRLKEVIKFMRMNLCHDEYPVQGPFDLVFCRNVMIYFDTPTKIAVVRRLLTRLSPDGYLFLGHAESLHGLVDDVKPAGPMTYRRVDP